LTAPTCPASTYGLRGKVFVTADGTAAMFISDTDIYDNPFAGDGPQIFYPSGYLMLRDGTRYRIDGGQVSWVVDRNGNKLTYAYSSQGVTITDSLNRQVTIANDVNDPTYGLSDRITYNGVGAQPRNIYVSKTSLGNALRSGYSLQTTQQLFPELNGSNYTQYNPSVIGSVWLPDGRRYRFYYNSYGELARVELPTGGAVEYDYAAGVDNGASNDSGVIGGSYSPYSIYRRVIERRLYKDGVTLESRMTYSRPESTSGNLGYVVLDQRNSGGTLLTREKHYFYGSASASFDQKAIDYAAWKDGREYQTEAFDSNGTTVLRRVANTWEQRAAVSWWTGAADAAPSNDPRLTETVTTLVDTNQVTQQTFSYDQYNNQTDVYEYNYGTGVVGSLARRTHTDYLATNPINGISYTSANIHLLSLPTQQQVFDAGGVEKARTTYEYDNYADDTYHKPLLDRSGITGKDATFTTLYQTRGNATRVSRWLLSSMTPVLIYAQYDVAGNAMKTIDARGIISQVAYSSTYQYAYPTSTTSAIPDPTGTYATNTALTTSTVYDFSTGLVTSATDANGKTTTVQYNDMLDRPALVTRPSGGGTTAYTYNDVAGNLYVRTLTSLDATRSIEAYQFFDNLGRPVRSFLNEGGSPVKFITSDTQYDALGRMWRVSNPYRTNGSNDPVNPSGNWTTTLYDALGRVKMVTTPDSAVVTTTYSGNQVTVQDQAGETRRSVTDALGRLTNVIEDPINGLAYQTSYSYDVLGNLVAVTQDTQHRYFMYDSLSRLIRAKNPEQDTNASLALSDPVSGNGQWSVGYSYDANGNLSTKTDARGVTATYAYDQINRNTTITYSDSTPAVSRYYDTATNGKGHLRTAYAGSVSLTAIDSYDAMGRPLTQRQQFYANGSWGTVYTTERTYNLAGQVTGQTYPSGRTVSYAYDAAGRTSSFTGNLGDGVSRTYSTNVQYDEWSGISRERFGTDTPLYHKEHRNVRGQLYDIRLSTVNDDLNWNRGAIVNYYSLANYGFGTSGTDNNGNLYVQQHWVPTDDAITGSSFMQQNYGYDALNRLNWMGEYQNGATNTGSQSYGYDRYGNRTISSASGTGINNKQFAVDTNTNRLGVPTGQSGAMQYDANGNLTNDTYSGMGSRAYDAENRMVSAINNASLQSTYTYDADGKRVRRSSYNQETWQVYGMDGELLAEYAANSAPSAPQKEYGYRNGELLVTVASKQRANVALASNGGAATASSTCFTAYPTSAVNNGDPKGVNWGTGGGWNDATVDAYPDWLQVDFNGSKTIDEIAVFTIQDNPASPAEPTEAMTFFLYGITAFDVQYWNGTAWVTVQNGSVTGNNLVWRRFTFQSITTSKVRVRVTDALSNYCADVR